MSAHCNYYTVGWICAIDTEYLVACELLDEEYEADQVPKIDSTKDPNIYTFGRVHHHNVVIACLPKGRYGVNSAAIVAERMRTTFPALRFGLMVGIAGGAPSNTQDIRLGDIVVSSPTPRHGGVIQYDFGKAIQDHEFDETGHLAPPPESLLHALSHMSMQHKRRGHRIAETISSMIEKNARLKDYGPSNERVDRLYHASYTHVDGGECECQRPNIDRIADFLPSPNLVARTTRQFDIGQPVVHYGLIASANRLMKNAIVRDALASKHDVLCFEMEAAGLMNSFPCIVIRGICDYSDTHKNDNWQPYAAASAAAYAKELLGIIPSTTQDKTSFDSKADFPQAHIQNKGGPSQACDRCRVVKTKCDAGRPSCSQCERSGQTCNYTIRSKLSCLTCRTRKTKCDMSLPSCLWCRARERLCEYPDPTLGWRPYTCQLCERKIRFARKDALERHMRIVHPDIRQEADQSNFQATPPTRTVSSRPEHHSPAQSPSQGGSPMSFTETSTEVLEYNTEGRVTKRTYSRTSSRSPVSGNTFRYDERRELETAEQAALERALADMAERSARIGTQSRGRSRLESISAPRGMPKTPQETYESNMEAEIVGDLDFLNHIIEAMRPEDSLACSNRLSNIRVKVHVLTSMLKEERQRYAEATGNDSNYTGIYNFPSYWEMPSIPTDFAGRGSAQSGAYGEPNQ